MPQTAAEQPEPVRVGRVPRISRLMALALRMEGLLRVRTVKDYGVGATGGVSRARITQLSQLAEPGAYDSGVTPSGKDHRSNR